MAKFKFPKRYDKDVAEAGVWFDVYDELGQHYGKFLLRYMNHNDPKLIAIRSRFIKANDVALKTKQLKDEDIVHHIFLEYSLLDWQGIQADGVDVPYSKEDAKEYFAEGEARFVMDQLTYYATSVESYQAVSPDEAKKK